MWNVLFIVDLISELIPLDVVCWMDCEEELRWSQFVELIKHYWTHITLVESSESFGLQAVIRIPIEYIPEEIWGIQSAIIGPRFIDKRWEACFITAELRIKKLCEKYSEINIPYHLQTLILCYVQNVSFKMFK